MKIYSISVFIILNIFLKNSTCENLKLLILHNNDMHSRFEETSRTSGTCKDKANCYGGFARVLHVIREARKAAADGTGPPVLYLNAGDTYTGTSWFSVHKWKIAADFMNLLHPDVASLGNHEFDYNVSGIVPYLHAVSFPIVAANLDFSKEPELEATNVTKSYIINISGHKIGVIGYLLPETTELADTEDVIFIDEVTAIKQESERLQQQGVNIIIALGHSGYQKDLIIAKEVPLVDLVVGGHTDTFLWNGPKPDIEIPEGPYPTVVKQSNGKKVPVVQPYSFTKYMGRLNIEFNEDGDAVAYSGEPQLLNSLIPQDEEALDLLEKYRPEVDALENERLGTTKVVLDGTPETCRHKECNIGNLITDAFVAYHAEMYTGPFWTDAPIGMYNSGAIRNSIDPVNGSVTSGEVLAAFPYCDPVYLLTLNGSDLLKTLEIGVRSNGETSYGEFLQVSGIRYKFDMSKPSGSRIVDIKVRCGACSIPRYKTIKPDKAYRILTRQFIIDGGDGHNILRDRSYNRVLEKLNECDILTWYIKKMSLIYIGEENRIVHQTSAGVSRYQTVYLLVSAMSFGNHEFDLSIGGILPYLQNIKFPIVAANMDFFQEPQLLQINILKSYVLKIKEHVIGVIGYLTPTTANVAETGNITFTNEVDAIRKESELLNQTGVKIIIALGHSGFEMDKHIAKEVPLVDVVIGGHTNTFLWNGPEPDLEVPEGPYPFYVEQVSGKKVPVVQAYAFTKYLGRLHLTFNDEGDIIECIGDAQLLNSTIPQDQDALKLLSVYRPKDESTIAGKSKVVLDGSDRSCRHRECNFGNLVTDSFVSYHATAYNGKFWTDAPIAILNGGTLRNVVVPDGYDGKITVADLLGAVPFVDKIVSMSLNGTSLLQALEVGVRSNGETSYGELLQTSGLRYKFDRSKPVGSRVLEARVRCGLCSVPYYAPIIPHETYRILTRKFISDGADGYTVLRDNGYDKVYEDENMFEILLWYVNKTSPIVLGEEDRLTVL